MFSAETLDLLATWTPIASSLFVILLLVLGGVALLLFAYRSPLAAWFATRWSESSTKHARTVAVTATAAYFGSRLGVPSIEPVSLNLVLILWGTAAYMFIRSDNPAPAGAPGGLAQCLLVGLIAVGLSGCAAIDAVNTGKPIDQAQVRQDLATSAAVVNEADCFVAQTAPVANEIATATGNQDAATAAGEAAAISKPLCKAPQ